MKTSENVCTGIGCILRRLSVQVVGCILRRLSVQVVGVHFTTIIGTGSWGAFYDDYLYR